MYELDSLRRKVNNDDALRELTETLWFLLNDGNIIQIMAYARNKVVDFSEVSCDEAKEMAISEAFHSFQIKTKSATYYVPLITYKGFTIEEMANGKLLTVIYANFEINLRC